MAFDGNHDEDEVAAGGSERKAGVAYFPPFHRLPSGDLRRGQMLCVGSMNWMADEITHWRGAAFVVSE